MYCNNGKRIEQKIDESKDDYGKKCLLLVKAEGLVT